MLQSLYFSGYASVANIFPQEYSVVSGTWKTLLFEMKFKEIGWMLSPLRKSSSWIEGAFPFSLMKSSKG